MAFGEIRPQRSYPFRAGTPDGQSVMSDQEFNQGWESRLAEVPRTLGGTSSTPLTGTTGASADPYLSQIDSADRNASYQMLGKERGQDTALDSALDFAHSMGLTVGDTSDGRVQYGTSAYGNAASGDGGHRVQTTSDTYANPEWERLNQQWQNEATMRGDAQSRYQQGYDIQRGAGMRNGMPGPEYSQSGFGAVNTAGGGEAGVAGSGNPAGVNMDWTGVYGGGNTGAVGMPTSTRRRWGV